MLSCGAEGEVEWGRRRAGAFKRGVLLFSGPNEDLAPAIGHDETDTEEVIGGLEAAGGDIALDWRNYQLAI